MVAPFTIVIPTLNEAPNVAPLVSRMVRALDDMEWQAVFVDDESTDGTADAVADEARRDPRVSCLRRVGKRGLSSAVIDGIMASPSPIVAVMDADLHHDETLLLAMIAAIDRDEADLVVASRYMAGGGTGSWRLDRRLISRTGVAFSRRILGVTLSDPMSGFFAVKRPLFVDAVPAMSGDGFKVLLDFMGASEGALRVLELPMQFGQRTAGKSKLDWRVMVEFLQLAWERRA